MQSKLVAFTLLLTTVLLLGDTLTVVYPESYPPYSFTDSLGNPSGFLIDWWLKWEEYADQSVKFTPAPTFDDAIAKVTNDEVDIIAGLFMTEERRGLLTYDDPILRTAVTLWARDDIQVDSISQLTEPIHVVKGDYAVKLLEIFDAELQIHNSYSELEESKRIDHANLFVTDIPIHEGRRSENYRKITGFKRIITLGEENVRPAVKRGNWKLRNQIREAANDIPAKEIRAIAKKWKFTRSTSKFSFSILRLVVIILTAILLTVIIISRKHSSINKNEWLDMIMRGESDSVEFKSSLRYDFRQTCTNKELEKIIAKTIAGFLNSNGGTLFIGVDDDGNILGLNNDYLSFSKKNSDGFLLALVNTINRYLGTTIHKFIKTKIIQHEGKELCVIQIEKSSQPVYLTQKNGHEEFYIRASASTQPLGMKDAYEYISLHWT